MTQNSINNRASSITFDGTNLLSNYVEVTDWTPSLTFGGGSTGITYSTQVGKYWRVGASAFFFFHIVLTSKGTDSGGILVTGFPFTHLRQVVYKPYYKNVTYTGSQLSCKCNNGLTTFNFANRGTGLPSTSLQSSAFANDTEVRVSGFSLIS